MDNPSCRILAIKQAAMKYLYPLIILLLVQLAGASQRIDQIALSIADDTVNPFWDHKVDPKIYYQVGKIIAARDLKKHIYLIQTYGNPDHEKPCSVCAWERTFKKNIFTLNDRLRLKLTR
jgi:hypothetical protein